MKETTSLGRALSHQKSLQTEEGARILFTISESVI